MDSKLYDNQLLIDWREDLGLTQEDVAKELNVVRATINRAETGKSASIELLYALSDFYRKPIDKLIRKNKFAGVS
jgi:transcriptional regulator with XRE-family HTH domain